MSSVRPASDAIVVITLHTVRITASRLSLITTLCCQKVLRPDYSHCDRTGECEVQRMSPVSCKSVADRAGHALKHAKYADVKSPVHKCYPFHYPNSLGCSDVTVRELSAFGDSHSNSSARATSSPSACVHGNVEPQSQRSTPSTAVMVRRAQ